MTPVVANNADDFFLYFPLLTSDVNAFSLNYEGRRYHNLKSYVFGISVHNPFMAILKLWSYFPS